MTTKYKPQFTPKSAPAVNFIEGVFNNITECLANVPTDLSESKAQGIIYGSLISYLQSQGVNVQKNLYWGEEEGSYKGKRHPLFSGKNYPDFIVKKPYHLAIEYKQGEYASYLKDLIGQSVFHTHSGEFQFVLSVFRDTTTDRKIDKTKSGTKEENLKDWLEKQNVFLRIVGKPRRE